MCGGLRNHKPAFAKECAMSNTVVRHKPIELTDQDVEDFVNDGYLVMPGLVSPSDIERLKRDTASIARGAYPSESLKPLPTEYSDDEALHEILCIHQPHYISPVMREFV